jgi:hypothetical protein
LIKFVLSSLSSVLAFPELNEHHCSISIGGIPLLILVTQETRCVGKSAWISPVKNTSDIFLAIYHLLVFIPLSRVTTICFLLSFSSITRHLHTHSFYYHVFIQSIYLILIRHVIYTFIFFLDIFLLPLSH